MQKHYHTVLLMTLALLAPVPGLSAVQEEQEVKAFQEMFGPGPQEEDVYRTDRLLVTATGSLKPVRLAPSVASVITKEDIEATGATTLEEALETVPGLHVYPNGTMLMEPNWSIRGIQAGLNPQVLLLLNGFPLSQSVQGNRPIGLQMPVSMISRIEVVRGPSSAVHGADAFAGTINVITKDGQEIEGTHAGVRYGSFATSDTWLQHGGSYSGWDLVMGVDWQKTSGDDNRIITRDGLGSGPPSLAPGALNTEHESIDTTLGLRKGRWTLHAYSTLIEVGMGHGGAQILSEDSEISTKVFQGDLAYDHEDFLPDWDLTLSGYSFFYENNNYFDFYPDTLGVNAIGNPLGNEWDSGLETSTVYKGFNDHRLRLACGFTAKDVDTDEYKNFGAGIAPANQFGELVNFNDTPYIFLNDQNRSLWYLSAQDEWTLARHWELTPGLRYDHYSDFGATANPRAALVWEPRYDLTTKLMYGRAFRAPTFAEQYFQNNPITLSNPDIDPETINTYEVALDYQPTDRLRTIASIFIYDIEGLIEYVPDPLPALSRTAQNYKNQEGRGFELEAEWQTTDTFTMKGNVAYQRSKDRDTDEIVPEAPELQFYANAHWLFLPDWSLDGQYFWVGGRHRDADDPRPDIDDYDLVNLTLRRKNIFNNWEAAVSIRNLLNNEIREPSPVPGVIPYDYPMESRMVWAEIRLHL